MEIRQEHLVELESVIGESSLLGSVIVLMPTLDIWVGSGAVARQMYREYW